MNSVKKEVVVIGAGPAGLQLGYFFEKYSIDYVILEKAEEAGAFFRQFPRHRKLISINKVHTGFEDKEINMRFDWNSLLSEEYEPLFKDLTKEYFPDADAFVEYLDNFRKKFSLKVEFNSNVEQISKVDDEFRIDLGNGKKYTCPNVVVATGTSLPYLPEINGIEHVVPYTECSVDTKEFENKRVLILGKGNSALETADHLIASASKIHVCSPNTVKMAWKTHFVGHVRAVNNNFLDTYQLKSQNALIDGNIDLIEKLQDGTLAATIKYGNADGEVEQLIYDAIIACTGFKFDASIFDDQVKPQLTIDDRFPDQNEKWESVNVKGLYFAGTITQMRDFKKSTSGFVHGFRYNCECLFHILHKKIKGKDWPYSNVKAESKEMTNLIIQNINRTSALWQQFGFICDAILIDGGEAKYLKSIPVDYLHKQARPNLDEYYTITLEYGNEIFEKAANPFNISRVHRNDIKNANKSAFLHPIIRKIYKGRQVAEHHVIEDFENKWDEQPIHIQPLIDFFEQHLLSDNRSDLLKNWKDSENMEKALV
ncbi:MAG: NAD(P)-binding domain-containing protein [Reichenbachiella sp.]|uniref:NAD(P)-binding domain-containing protein n=1 Tax=Reichenbachiella sp. TaxID=2184521 RepID=UPI00329A3894